MLTDLRAEPPEYRPTNFWEVYEQRFVPELLTQGLHDFRRRRGSVLASMGATDLIPSLGRVDFSETRLASAGWRRLPGWGRALKKIEVAVASLLPLTRELDYDTVRRLAYVVCELIGERSGARPPADLSMSTAGNPEDVFAVGDSFYSVAFLDYYLSYAYCCSFRDFDRISTVVELGTGAGKQFEVMKKLHPHLTLLAFDLPPQLYVCEQYLKTVFPDDVVPYREARKLTTLEEVRPGSVVILGNWRFPLIQDIAVDLFWNAASFQEMEPAIVANYLSSVDASAAAVFLQQVVHGHFLAAGPGSPGVLDRTTFEDYERGLPHLDRIDLSTTVRPTGPTEEYANSFWHRRAA